MLTSKANQATKKEGEEPIIIILNIITAPKRKIEGLAKIKKPSTQKSVSSFFKDYNNKRKFNPFLDLQSNAFISHLVYFIIYKLIHETLIIFY